MTISLTFACVIIVLFYVFKLSRCSENDLQVILNLKNMILDALIKLLNGVTFTHLRIKHFLVKISSV